MTSQPRYFWTRKAKDGLYRIMDRKLDLHIASCNFREAANLITDSLNKADTSELDKHISSIQRGKPLDLADSSSRAAHWGDLCHGTAPQSSWFDAGWAGTQFTSRR